MNKNYPWVNWLSVAAIFFVAANGFAKTVSFANNWAEPGFNLVAQDNNGVDITFSVDNIEISDIDINGELMQNINMPGVFLPNNAGAPNLPGTGRFIALPHGAKVELEIVSYRTEVMHNMNIAPAFKIPAENDDAPLKYEKDPNIYSTNALYPVQPVIISELTDLRGVDVVILGITPFQYNPVTRDLIVYKDLQVRVNFVGGNGHFGEDRLRSRFFEPILEQNILNYASLPKIDFNRARFKTGSDEDNVEYIIIVPNDPAFLAWADTIKRWRSEQGIITGITTLSEIGGNDATLIENYINNAYNNWTIPPVAVLLLSDYQASGSEIYGITAPIWNSYCASDNIYADVNGNNLPDICLARITAQNNGQLTTMIKKMLDYERTPYTDPNFYYRPLITGGWQSDRWFILCCEVVWGFMHNELGKDPRREYAGASGPPSSWSTNPNTSMIVNYFGPTGLGYIGATPSYLTSWTGSATTINNAINSGAFLVLHRDHGEETGWSSPSYHNSDLAGLNNTKYPFVFSINCLTGKYNWSSECFTEAFHRYPYRALGLIAATEVSYSFVNDAYLWGVWDCMWPEFDPGYGGTTGNYNLMPSFGNASGKYYLAASSWPYNPGDKTVTYHLFHHHGDAFITMYSEVPQNPTVTHDNALIGGMTSFTVTANAGSLIGLSVDGEVIGSADGTGLPVSIPIPTQMPGSVMKVTVTKANYYRYMADVPVIPPSGPYVTYSSCEINDAIMGNNNGLWDFGETVDLSIGVKNIGVAPAPDVNVTIATADPLITIIDGQHAYGTILAGDTVVIPNGFRVLAAQNIPDQHIVAFTLTATSGINTWESNFSLIVNAPIIEYDTLVIQDPGGNNNGALDPGETADFLLTLVNSGHSTVQNVTVNMSSSNPLVTVSGNPGTYGNLAPNASATDTWVVIAASSVPAGTNVTFTLNITGNGGYTTTETFTIIVGDVRNMPTGPDAYGYKAWDNMDGGESHPYNWVEIAPMAGGSGTVLNITSDDQTVQANLPFTFRHYGQNYTQISVCSNGWLAMGSTTMNAYTNTTLPNTGAPPAIIAPFWDDLYPPGGNFQICTYRNDAQHYYVIEWYNIAHYGATSTRETFEVILYDPAYYSTTTGDGIILVQYNMVQNAASATFGIQNQPMNIGIQYGYNGGYDVHAWQVQNGRTITYTTNVSGPPPNVHVGLTPYGTPIQIPASGGSFNFNIAVANNGTTQVTAGVWCMVTLPNGAPYGPVLGPVNITMPTGFSTNRDRSQTVPASAPSGNYMYRAYIGVYPNVIWDQDSFPFQKLTTGGEVWIEKWLNQGEPISK